MKIPNNSKPWVVIVLYLNGNAGSPDLSVFSIFLVEIQGLQGPLLRWRPWISLAPSVSPSFHVQVVGEGSEGGWGSGGGDALRRKFDLEMVYL